MRRTLAALLALLSIALFLASLALALATEGYRVVRADGGGDAHGRDHLGDARFAGSTPSTRRAVGVAA